MDKKFLFLVFAFFLVFGTFSIAVFFDQSGATLQTRASNQCEPAESKSLIVSFPKSGLEPGEPCQVNVFARCTDETAVTGADVTLSVTNGTTDPAGSATTDEAGKAVFNVTPNGLAEITATINGTLQLPETVTCSSQ